jgi:hypothetical protein
MHEVHSKLEKTSPDPSEVLPESVIKLYNDNKENLEFWNSEDDSGVINNQPKVINPNIPPNTPKNNYNLFS